jgi:TonB-dependent SusC/RagA subfamily outer membrane receptor
VVQHEEEHQRARDPAFLALALAFLTLAPWNPAAWWALARYRLAMEVDCDRRVLATGVSKRAYGALLLEVGAGISRRVSFSPALAEGHTSQLERRLRMMRNNVRRQPLLVGLGSTILAVGFLVLACDAPTPPENGQAPGAVPEASAAPKIEATKKIDASGTSIMEDAPPTVQAVVEAEPLIYVDGVRIQSASPKEALADLDPDSIERIEVIKGAAASAVYGEDAKNGVILIFRKK